MDTCTLKTRSFSSAVLVLETVATETNSGGHRPTRILAATAVHCTGRAQHDWAASPRLEKDSCSNAGQAWVAFARKHLEVQSTMGNLTPHGAFAAVEASLQKQIEIAPELAITAVH